MLCINKRLYRAYRANRTYRADGAYWTYRTHRAIGCHRSYRGHWQSSSCRSAVRLCVAGPGRNKRE